MIDGRGWVMDTSTFTHLCRAGHADIIERLAPGRLVLIPMDVNDEIERGRLSYSGIPAISAVEWAEVAVLTEEEKWTQLQIKARMAGAKSEHLGECAVIACACHRDLVAFLDERAAIEQADRLGVRTHDTLWLVIEAYKELFGRGRDRAALIIDDLLATGMYLPIGSGKSLLAWAYEEGLLP
jgi:predicted nucleic acid-binding protein